MRPVIERVFNTHSHEVMPSTIETAEALAGVRLDRRRVYAIINREVCATSSWTQSCSGCNSDDPCRADEQGAGCDECGYTGLCRVSMWIPLSAISAQAEA